MWVSIACIRVMSRVISRVSVRTICTTGSLSYYHYIKTGGGMLNFLQSCSVRSAYLAPLGCGTRHSWQVVVGRWVLEVKRFRGRFQVVQACGRPIVMNCHVLKNDFSVNVFVNISLSMAQHACGCHPQFKGPAGRAISVSLKFSPCVRHAPSPRAGTNVRRTSDCGAQWATG